MGTHCGVHDARAVCSDGVGDVADVNGVQVLVVGLTLHKYLHPNNKLEFFIDTYTCRYTLYMYTGVLPTELPRHILY